MTDVLILYILKLWFTFFSQQLINNISLFSGGEHNAVTSA